MHIPLHLRKWLWAVPAVVVLLLPGWRGALVPVRHEQMWDDLRTTAEAVGVALPDGEDGAEWHATYVENQIAGALETLRLRDVLPSVSAPNYVAHVPAGAMRADAYYAVERHSHWPWWWPGGGMDWGRPE